MENITPLSEAAHTAALTTHVSPAHADPALHAATESTPPSEQYYTTAPDASAGHSAAAAQNPRLNPGADPEGSARAGSNAEESGSCEHLRTGVIDDRAAVEAADQPVAPAPARATRCKWPIPKVPGLSIQQRAALAALIAGKGPNAAARIAGVDRSTLYRWRTDDIDFIAALNCWRNQAMESTIDCLRNGAQYAAATVVNAAREGNVAASVALLKGMGVLAPQAVGPQTTDAVRQAMELKTMLEYNDSLQRRGRAIRDRLLYITDADRLELSDGDKSEAHSKKLAEMERQEAAETTANPPATPSAENSGQP